MNEAANQDPVSRIGARLLASGVPLARQSLLQAAQSIAAVEDPLHAAESASAAVDELVGMGPLEPLLADDSVSDVLVNGSEDIWIERAGVLKRTAVRFRNAESLVAAVERVIAPLGLRLDHASPVVDARLPDGSRLHAILPPVAPDGPIVAIRRFTRAVGSLEEMVAVGSLSGRHADLLRQAVLDRLNLLVCGGTGSGKTTLLNVLSCEIPDHERVVTVEDAAELQLSGHVVRLESRPANPEGAGEVSLGELVRHALRLRPDRIVVGEVRGGEAADMIQAMATGHAGSMSTVHASDPEDALSRLELMALGARPGLAASALRSLLRSVVDLVVVMGRACGVRSVNGIFAVDADRVVQQ
ncbi:MAG: CpaF family protein [Acidimicrobiia bacterium]|nr:CpaF family protein [Acidimicrobiia bacterium]